MMKYDGNFESHKGISMWHEWPEFHALRPAKEAVPTLVMDCFERKHRHLSEHSSYQYLVCGKRTNPRHYSRESENTLADFV